MSTENTPNSGPNSNSTTSKSLVQRAQRADPLAWDRLVRIYSPVVYGWARGAGLQEVDASDVMQDVFHTLTTQLGKFQRRSESDSFRGWLFSVTRNKIRDYFRRRKSQAPAAGGTNAQERWNEIPDSPPEETSLEGRSEIQGVRRRALELASGDFESRTWQAFWRTSIEGDAPADVASDLGMSVWAVYKARTRILTKLRAEFEELL